VKLTIQRKCTSTN